MLELIIVIIVAGILAAVMIPRLERDSLREAANQVVRHIQYTQHLAMMNDVYDATNPAVTTWYQNRWSIDLCNSDYKIERANSTETAEDPLTQRDINGTDNDLADMGITGIAVSTTSTGTVSAGSDYGCRIIFDNLGRPYSSDGVPLAPTDNQLNADETITLNAGATRTAVITITKETGYVTLTSLN